MTGHRSSIKGYVIDAKGRLVPKPAYNVPKNIAVQKAKSKRKYRPAAKVPQ